MKATYNQSDLIVNSACALNLQFSCPQGIFMIDFLDNSKNRKNKIKNIDFCRSLEN